MTNHELKSAWIRSGEKVRERRSMFSAIHKMLKEIEQIENEIMAEFNITANDLI